MPNGPTLEDLINAGVGGNVEVVGPDKPFLPQGAWLLNGNISLHAQHLFSSASRENQRRIYEAFQPDATVGRQFSVRRQGGSGQIVYGRARVGSDITYLETDLEDGGQFLYGALTYAAHRVKQIEKVFFNDVEVTYPNSPPSGIANGDWTNATYLSQESKGADDQAANSAMVFFADALVNLTWSLNHRQRGFAHAIMWWFYNKVFYPEGFPSVSLEVSGKDDIYDPRLDPNWDTSPDPTNASYQAHTSNSALIAADFITNTRWGLSVPWSKVDLAVLRSSADTCDEDVSLASGGTEKRYECNGVLRTSARPRDNFAAIKATLGNDCFPVDGVWKILVGEWSTPVITLTENDIIGRGLLNAKRSRRDTYNGVKGTYVNENGKTVDFPAVKNSTYLAEDDGLENLHDLHFQMVKSAAQCQRLGKIILEDGRQPLIYEDEFKSKALIAHAGDNIQLDHAKLGWSGKYFRIVRQSDEISTSNPPRDRVSMMLKETDPSIYTWSAEETTVDPAPNTNLPTPGAVIPPSNIILESGTDQLAIKGDGTPLSRLKISWTESGDPFVQGEGYHEVQTKKSSSSTWRSLGLVRSGNNFTFDVEVEDNVSYDARVRAVNGLLHESPWILATNHMVIGKTAKPSDVQNFVYSRQNEKILLSWDPITDLDKKDYEIRRGATFDTGTRIASEIDVTEFLWENQSAGSYTVWIKARDTSLNQSQNATRLDITIAAPSVPQNVQFSFNGPNLEITWEDPAFSDFAIDHFEVRYGLDVENSILLERSKVTRFSRRADWLGLRRFWIIAKDTARNAGAAASLDISVEAPSVVQNLGTRPLNTSVLIDWTEPASGTLPVDRYKVLRGDVFASATLVGYVSGTFTTDQILTTSEETYWILGVDSAGNEGGELSVTEKLILPPNFVLQSQAVLDPDNFDTKTNAVVFEQGGVNKFLVPAVTPQTIQQHVEAPDPDWVTFQDKIDDGYSLWCLPSNTSPSTVLEEVDLGVNISASFIKLTFNAENLAGTVTHVPYISYSSDAVSWIRVQAATVFAENFRYIRLEVESTAANDQSIACLSNIGYRVDVEKAIDNGSGTSLASGTLTVDFNLDYLSVQTVNVTPNSSSARIVAPDNFGGASPTSFDLIITDKDGTQVAEDFTWTAIGYADPGI